jgi:transcription factor SPN1
MSDNGSRAGSLPANEDPIEEIPEDVDDDMAGAGSDRDSDALSEVDEDQLEDYDPETANIEDRPVDIDEDIARTLKATKRKRVDGEAPVRKPREGRREKKRRDRDEDVPMDDADDGAKKSRRPRRAADGERRARAKPSSPEPEDENLTPEQRRKRAIDQALNAALKKPSGQKRRKKDEIVGSLDTSALDNDLHLSSSRTLKRRSMTNLRISSFGWRTHAAPTTRLVRLVYQPSTNSSCFPKSLVF